jgi:hypothetical protein
MNRAKIRDGWPALPAAIQPAATAYSHRPTTRNSTNNCAEATSHRLSRGSRAARGAETVSLGCNPWLPVAIVTADDVLPPAG